MVRTRKPPALAAAERQLAEAQYAISHHRQYCAKCHWALKADMPGQACDLGWSYLKLERRATAQLRDETARQEALSATQLALW